MAEILKIGVVGTGGIADGAHAPAISGLDDVELVSVLSRSAESGQAFLERHNPRATAFTSIDELAGSDVDIVVVCSPDRLHFEHASECLKTGKHVLLEKPMQF